MIYKRRALSFSDMKCRTFLDYSNDTAIVILEPIKNRIEGYIEWTITRNGSHIKLFATPKVAKEHDRHAPVRYNCSFSKVSKDLISHKSLKTWRQCEVSGLEFINNELVNEFIYSKSLGFIFNKLMRQMFGRMNYVRPLTDPGIDFKPLAQQNVKYMIVENKAVLWYPLPNKCAAVWSLDCEDMHEITFVPNRYDLASINSDTTHNLIDSFFHNKNAVWRNEFYSHLLDDNYLLKGCKTRLAGRRVINLAYETQAKLWYNLVTTTKK